MQTVVSKNTFYLNSKDILYANKLLKLWKLLILIVFVRSASTTLPLRRIFEGSPNFIGNICLGAALTF